jgi:hypothetical protein
MNTCGNHALEKYGRRLGVQDAGFGGPICPTGTLLSMFYGDRQILVPGNRPICFGRFVEENRADGTSGISEKRTQLVLEESRRCADCG